MKTNSQLPIDVNNMPQAVKVTSLLYANHNIKVLQKLRKSPWRTDNFCKWVSLNEGKNKLVLFGGKLKLKIVYYIFNVRNLE